MQTGIEISGNGAPPTTYRASTRLLAAGPEEAPELSAVVAEFTLTCGLDWSPITRRKYAADFDRFLAWLAETGRPATTLSFDLATLAAYVADLRGRSKIHGIWRGEPGAAARRAGDGLPLSANTVNSYVRPLRALAGWLADEGHIAVDPFRRARRFASRNPLLPSEETPTKSATLDDLRALERGCAGDAPLDLRDQAIVAVLVSTAARNSSVRLLLLSDVSFERSIVRFRRAKGAKTLEIALHPMARLAIERFLRDGRPALVPEHGNGGYLFPAHHGDGLPLGMSALSHMLTRRYRAGGGSLPYFGSHRIRHGTATLLVNNGMPLEEVSRYLGHSSTDVTRRYAIHTSDSLGRRAADALSRAGLGE